MRNASPMTNEAPNPTPLVLIEWRDSAQPTPGWQFLTDYSPSGAISCVSVGYLVHDGDETKGLAQNLGCGASEESMQASGIIHIPACSITRQVALAELGV